MPLYTKSVQLPVSPEDGIRVCIMRRPDADAQWDIWMPTLSPSHEILTASQQGLISSAEFDAWFEEHVLVGQHEYLDILVEMAAKRTITILCWEIDPDECHRKTVAEECVRIAPTLEVVIR